MLNKSKLITACIIISLGIVSATSAQTQEKKTKAPFRASASVGWEYDSNVSVDEVDVDSTAGDSLIALAANLSYKNNLSEKTSGTLSYGFSQNSYSDFSSFDLRTHTVSGNLTHDFGKFKGGSTVRHIIADLDSEDFLTLDQISFFANRFVNKTVYLHGEYTYTDKELDSFAGRDATKNSLSADVYFFLDGAKRFWVVGYKYEDEDANDAQFDRSIQSFKVRYNHRFQALGREMKIKLKSRYQLRDYDAITPSIGEIRDEDRLRLGVELEIPLKNRFFTVVEYEYSDFSSNLPSADYTQSVIGIKVGWRNH